jgi:SAM-dependent methyltransferase
MYSQDAYHDEHYAELNVGVHSDAVMLAANFFGNCSGKRLLDFGCGNGAFMVAANDAGFLCTGVEFSSSTVSRLRETMEFAIFDSKSFCSSSLKFDVIHVGHVLEHVLDPEETMNMLRGHLAPGGVFLLEGPLESNFSISNWSARAVGWLKRAIIPGRVGLHPPFHLYLTNAKAQRMFFERSLRLQVLRFYVSDSGGAYANANPKNLGGVIKTCLSVFSKGVSSIVPGSGDVFLALASCDAEPHV